MVRGREIEITFDINQTYDQTADFYQDLLESLWLYLSTRDKVDGIREVRLTIDKDSTSYRQWHSPKLSSPSGAIVISGDSFNDRWNQVIHARPQASLDSTALADHYANQMRLANWTELSRGENGSLSWHSFISPVKDSAMWWGMLLAMGSPEEDRESHVLMMAPSYTPFFQC